MARFILICLALFIASNTLAQEKKIRIGLFHGSDFLTNGSQTNMTPPDLFLDAEYLIGSHLGVGIEAGWMEDARSIKTSNPPIKERTDRFIFLLKVRYYLRPGEKIQPYGSLGAGTALYNSKDGDWDINNNLQYTYDTQLRWAINPEIGIRVYWFNFGIGYNIFDRFDTTINSNYNSIEIIFGGSFYFGKSKGS